MAIDTFGIPLAYLIVASLTLWILISLRGMWWLKALVTLLALFFGIGLWGSLDAIQGWPVDAALPERFEIKWLHVVEPDKRSGSPGEVLLWARDLGTRPAARRPFFLPHNGGEGRREPRVYRLPYSRPLHEQSEKIQEMIGTGGRFFATMQQGALREGGGKIGGPAPGKGSVGGTPAEETTGTTDQPVVGSGRRSRQDFIFHQLPPPRLPVKESPAHSLPGGGEGGPGE